jgi:hypothetical protein
LLSKSAVVAKGSCQREVCVGGCRVAGLGGAAWLGVLGRGDRRGGRGRAAPPAPCQARPLPPPPTAEGLACVSLAVLDASFVRKKGGGVAVGGRLGIGKILLKKGGTPA